VCEDCRGLVRTQPDGNGWKASFFVSEGAVICHHCVKKDPSDYLQHLEGGHGNYMTIDIDLTKHGYVLLQDGFESGVYGGQKASKNAIADALRSQKIRRFIFKLDAVSPFDFRFSVYVHESEMERLDKKAFKSANKELKIDPAERMKAALMGKR